MEDMDRIYEMCNDILVKLDSISTQEELDALKMIIENVPTNLELIRELKTYFKMAQISRDDLIEMKLNTISILDTVISDKIELLSKNKKSRLEQEKVNFLPIYKKALQDLYNTIIVGYDRDVINVAFERCNDNAMEPKYAHEGDAGFDFYLAEDITINPGETKIAKTGLKIRVPMGYELQVRPRSGMSAKTKLRIANAPGTVDCGYADEIGIICENIGVEPIELKIGDRIAQGVLNEVPMAHFIEIKDLSDLMKNEDRGGGFGSTGK